jgi:hypothetical protein
MSPLSQVSQGLSRGPDGEPHWSWRLFLLMAAAWALMLVGFRAASWAEGSTTPWLSDVIWRGSNAVLWLAFSPPIFFLTRAFPVPGDRRIRNAAIHWFAALAMAVAHLLIFLPLNQWLDPDFRLRFASLHEAFANQAVYRTVTGMITYGAIFFVFASDAHDRRARLERHRAEELRHQLSEAQLRALRMQIQPHFLFNTLHSISSLIHEAPSEALSMVSRLGDFLRAALERGSSQTIRFEEELRFAQLYLDIERVRFGDRLRVSIEASPEALAAQTPTLILQPLVENTIRHGVAPSMGLVDLQIVADVRDGRLAVLLRNAERDPDPARATAAPTEGLGLANTRERLRQAYGEAATLEVEAARPGAFQVTVRLPVEARHAEA